MSTPTSDPPTQPGGSLDAKAAAVAAGAEDKTQVGQQPPAGPPPANPASGGDYSLPIMIGVFVLALVGIGLLGLGIYAVAKLGSNNVVAAGPSTATRAPRPTLVVLVPTTTPAPPATNTATASATAVPPTATKTAMASSITATTSLTATAAGITPTAAGGLVTMVQGVNVRGGPGTNYLVVGNIKAGDTAPAVGRNSTGDWFVISFKNGPAGQGWVSANSSISSYSGDKSQLPVVAAPPVPATPVPSATPMPAGNPNGALVNGAHGVSGMLNLCSHQVVFAVNERVCFVEWIKNNSAQAVPYGLLGVTAVKDSGGAQFQTSWSGEQAAHGLLGIDPGCIGPTDRCKGQWEDGIRLGSAGGYRLYLSVCFSDFPTCLGKSGDWETLSGAIVISVQ
jgi:uncharacterized protein YraI